MESLKVGQRAVFTPAHALPRRARQALPPCAAKAPKEAVIEGGFRWDPVMQRWARSKVNDGKPQATTVEPLSGVAYVVWPVMWDYLKRNNLKSISNQEALALMKKGAVLLDVRLPEDYERGHAAGAINVSMFRRTAGNSPWDTLKKVVMAAIAQRATERNPDFAAEAERAVGNKRKKIIVMCSSGGTLSTIARVESSGKQANDPDKQFGRETRSLKACYELMQAGFTDVVHLQGGLSSWRFEDLPMESE